MKKISSVFERDRAGDRQVFNQVVPGTEWVLAGEGVATRKWDGTCCLIRDGRFFKRYEVKKGGRWPKEFEPATEIDPNTGKQQGWVPVGDGPEDKYHREAFETAGATLIDGTYEVIGPKVQGGIEGGEKHRLVRHGDEVLADVPRDFERLRDFLRELDIEGVVFHHPDGRMAKVKKKDFGFERTALRV